MGEFKAADVTRHWLMYLDACAPVADRTHAGSITGLPIDVVWRILKVGDLAAHQLKQVPTPFVRSVIGDAGRTFFLARDGHAIGTADHDPEMPSAQMLNHVYYSYILQEIRRDPLCAKLQLGLKPEVVALIESANADYILALSMSHAPMVTSRHTVRWWRTWLDVADANRRAAADVVAVRAL